MASDPTWRPSVVVVGATATGAGTGKLVGGAVGINNGFPVGANVGRKGDGMDCGLLLKKASHLLNSAPMVIFTFDSRKIVLRFHSVDQDCGKCLWEMLAGAGTQKLKRD